MPNTFRSILVILITTLLFSCATTQSAVVTKSATISASEYAKECDPPDERHYLPQLNVKVFRHSNCLGVKDLLSVVWTGESNKRTKDGASMVAISFAMHLTERHPGTTYSVVPINIDTLTHGDTDYHMAFFEIRRRN